MGNEPPPRPLDLASRVEPHVKWPLGRQGRQTASGQIIESGSGDEGRYDLDLLARQGRVHPERIPVGRRAREQCHDSIAQSKPLDRALHGHKSLQ
jgi:hypothetical protein